MFEPNKRGRAHRSNDRNTRYATHIPVLKECINALSASKERPIHVIEHGMGLGSTPFFHSLQHVKKITSFERELEWIWCASCISGSKQDHTMILLENDNAIEQIKQYIDDPSRTVALIDGYASQRVKVLEVWMNLGIKFIVEHDGEVLTHGEITIRRKLALANNYVAMQYTGHDPETVLFVKSALPQLPDSYQPF
jgi:hypothetical protein